MAWSFLQNWGYDGTNDVFNNNQAMHRYENTTEEDQLVRSYFVRVGTGNATYVSENEDNELYYTTGKGVPFTITAFATGSDGVKSTTTSIVRTKSDGTTVTYETTATVDNIVTRRAYYTAAGNTCYTVEESECEKYEFTFDVPVRVAAGSSIDFYIDFNKVSSSDYNVVIAQDRRTTNAYGGTVTAAYFTVTYDANGGTDAPAAQEKTPGVTLTLTTSQPTPPTGKNFLGWGLTASDTTKTYSPGDSYTEDTDITLFAVYEWKTYTITYNKNGYAATNFPSNQTKTHGTGITLRTNIPVITSSSVEHAYQVDLDASPGSCTQSQISVDRDVTFTFLCWNTEADGSGDDFNPGDSYNVNSNRTLYLQVNKVCIDRSIDLPVATRAGYTHVGWIENWPRRVFKANVLRNGELVEPLPIEFCERTDSTEVLDYSTSGFTFTYGRYDYNDADVSVPVLYRQAEDFSTPDHRDPYYYSGTITYSGHTYDRWTPAVGSSYYTEVVTEETDVTTIYTDTYLPTTDAVLYAVWKASGIVYIDNGTTFEPYSIWIDNGSGWDQYTAYVDNGSGWDPCG